MQEKILTTVLKIYHQGNELPEASRILLQEARAALETAYAPYSGFEVGAAIRLANGEIIRGSNQENAAYPMCLCAERVALSSAATRFPEIPVEAIAITFRNTRRQGSSQPSLADTPAAPCGACRQSICETEDRHQSPIEVLLQGESGPVYSLSSGRDLLPLAFTGEWLKGKNGS